MSEMPKQLSFADAEYRSKKKQTRRERFLAEMERVMPWAELVEELRPHYYKEYGRGPGRPPIALERILRMLCLQHWFTLSDEGLEDAVYDSQAFRAFLGLDLARESVPDATTVLKFRRLLEDKGLGERLFERVNALLSERGLLLDKGTVVDATILHAPSSTKNAEKARDPEMHQTRKGNQWYFGMKAHIGADLHSGAVHSLSCTAANVADIVETANLLHGREKTVFADAGYIGADKRPELKDHDVQWQIAEKRGKLAAMQDGELKELARQAERLKAQIRARVEHPFHVVKNLFGHRKTRYRGLKKNANQMHLLFAWANLYLLRRPLAA